MTVNDVFYSGPGTQWADELRPQPFGIAHQSDPNTVGPVKGVKFHAWLQYYAPGDPVSLWDVAQWDSADTWTGDAIEHDVACDVISIGTNEGRDAPLGRFRVGTASIVVNDPEGIYTPWTDAADAESYSRIRPGIGLRIGATYNDVDYPIFHGTVDAIADEFPNVTGHEVTFNATDDLKYLALVDGIEQPPVGAGELPGARLERIFAAIGYQGMPQLDAGSIPLLATVLNQNMESEAGIVIDTEVGALFCLPDGTIRFRDRTGLETDPLYTEVQLVFGEVEPELCYDEIALLMNVDEVKNIVTVANTKPPGDDTAPEPIKHTVSDTHSIARYGQHTYQRTDLIHEDDAQGPTIAQIYLDTWKDAAQRIDSLSFKPSVFPNTIEAALTIGLLWMVEVRRRATGFQVVAQLQTESIEHTISAHEWNVNLKTFGAAAVFKVGLWDRDVWDEGLWAY
jgi:hypothetical protein